VATVSSTGLVTALTSGSTTVTATDVPTGIQGTATLTVIPVGSVAVSIAVTPNSPTTIVSSTEQFTAVATYNNGSQGDITANVTWASSDLSVATVASGGLATALTSGTTTVTATDLPSGIQGTATLTVPASNLGLIMPTPVTTTTANPVASLSVTIPQNVVSIGISVKGTNFLFKFIDHGLLITPLQFITGPDGNVVPLSFNMIDSNRDGTETPLGDNLINAQVASLFFPNDGTTPALAAGLYTFPIGSLDAAGTLGTDTLTPLVYYKTNISAQQTMKVNLLVVQGVSGGITDDASAAADPEIQGAIQVLRNVYETQVGLTLEVAVSVVADASFVSIDSLAEQDLLLSSFPVNATNDALNLFIVGSLNYVPTSVIGLSTGVPGPFNLQRTILSGTLAEYQGDGTGSDLGYILAHEFGHYLGLWHTSQTSTSGPLKIIGHDPIADTAECTTAQVTMSGNIDNCPDRSNLMFPFLNLNETNPPITDGQATVVKLNPAIMVR
ncbi:MAG: Ig-like domain-containing protein, partial [SAR324 cluster bacterium]|nr:Ig-like domain-containing protein [SAR324 cluster bacterium]